VPPHPPVVKDIRQHKYSAKKLSQESQACLEQTHQREIRVRWLSCLVTGSVHPAVFLRNCWKGLKKMKRRSLFNPKGLGVGNHAIA